MKKMVSVLLAISILASVSANTMVYADSPQQADVEISTKSAGASYKNYLASLEETNFSSAMKVDLTAENTTVVSGDASLTTPSTDKPHPNPGTGEDTHYILCIAFFVLSSGILYGLNRLPKSHQK